jgi:hypothetical protein
MLHMRGFCVCASLLLASLCPSRALADTQAEPVDCTIENPNPEVQLGAQATYIVHLSGGFGSYSVTFAYGDGAQDGRSVTGTETSFAHLFTATGFYTQTAWVSGAGSNASCGTTTSVY